MQQRKLFKISTAGGLTLLTFDKFTRSEKQSIVRAKKDVEQFGTVRVIGNRAYVDFWGKEFSGAGSMAVAVLDPRIKMIECLGMQITVCKKENFVSLKIPKNIILETIEENNGTYVIENGISFFLSKSKQETIAKENVIRGFARAEGYIQMMQNKLLSYVYVREFDTFNLENTCISASIAAKYLYPDINAFEQASGQIVKIQDTENSYSVEAKVKLIKTIYYKS